MKLQRLMCLVAMVALTACAGTPGPGDSGYAYNVDGHYSGSVNVDGQAFSGPIQLSTAPGGVVTGSFSVTSPVSLGGDVEGTLLNDQLTIRMTYGNNPLTGCDGGTMTGTLTVTEGGARISGTVVIDDCGQVIDAMVTYQR
jgi:hypothetical protein